jgi:predicted nucleotidyltransferase
MLIELFTSLARIEVLKLFLLNPVNRYYLREIQDLTGQPLQAVQRETRKLARIGLLIPEPDGNRLYYSINRSFPIFPELKAIFYKTVGLGAALAQATEEHGDIELAFVFGSSAAHQEDAQSDIDLCVIGAISSRKLHESLAATKKDLRRELNIVLFSLAEFRRRIDDNNHFVNALLTGPKIFVKGSEDEFRRLAETEAAARP